jgi:hypothetical protein
VAPWKPYKGNANMFSILSTESIILQFPGYTNFIKNNLSGIEHTQSKGKERLQNLSSF